MVISPQSQMDKVLQPPQNQQRISYCLEGVPAFVSKKKDFTSLDSFFILNF